MLSIDDRIPGVESQVDAEPSDPQADGDHADEDDGGTSLCGRPPDEPTGGISIHYLGQFFVEIDGEIVRRWRAGRAQLLFQFLAMHHDRPVSSDMLNEILWPEMVGRRSSGLKVAVHALREILASTQDSSTHDRAASIELASFSGGYVLETEGVSIDFEQLASHVERAHLLDRRGERREAVRHYRRAVDCYHGEFLCGLSEDWVHSRREWLKDLALRSLDRLVKQAVQRQEYEAAIAWCHRALDIDHCHEPSYRILMLCHAALGHLGRVKALHDLCTQRLRDEIGVEPDAETQALARRLLPRASVRPATGMLHTEHLIEEQLA